MKFSYYKQNELLKTKQKSFTITVVKQTTIVNKQKNHCIYFTDAKKTVIMNKKLFEK